MIFNLNRAKKIGRYSSLKDARIRLILQWYYLGLSVSGSVPMNGNPLDNSFLRVFEHAGVFRQIFSFILRQVIMGSRVPVNQNPPRVPSTWKREQAPGS